MDGNRRLVSIFDTLGPIMTGPSSSHTAGVLRIGRVGRMFLGGDPERVDLYFYGNALARTYKGHMSDSGIVAGLMDMGEDDPRIKDALGVAAGKGIAVAYHADHASKRDPNTVGMLLRRGGAALRVAGITVGGGEILMTELEGFPIELRGDEDGVIVIADASFDSGLFREVFKSEYKGPSVSSKGEKRLYTCLLPKPAPRRLCETLRALAGVEAVYPLKAVLDYKLSDSAPLFSSVGELLETAETRGLSVADMAIAYEKKRSALSEAQIRARIRRLWAVMLKSMDEGLSNPGEMLAGFIPNDEGKKLIEAVKAGKTLGGPTLGKAIGRALAAMETNGCARCVAAAPTAGSCGVLPGALLTAAENLGATEEKIGAALLTAAIIGTLIAMRASLSGSAGGCQSEIGVASAMTAAALVQMGGGSPNQIAQGMALALKNVLGLICDPVAGPVEIPCVKRNSIGVANAFAAADMALAGLESAIPPDEVIGALVNAQKLLPSALKGTMLGGLGSTPTAKRLKEEWDRRIAPR